MKARLNYFLIALLVLNSTPFIDNSEKNELGIDTSIGFPNNNANKSIILMIGDGMGFEHLKLAQFVELGMNKCLTIEELPYINNISTYSADNIITDSAAAATAIATGHKTNNGMLSVSPSLIYLETILEIAQNLGKSTGIVTTTSIIHATPAAFMTHVNSRSLTSEIVRQIIEDSNVDLLLGGGMAYFNNEQLNSLESKGYNIVENYIDLVGSNSSKILGLFADNDMPYEADRNPLTIPSLFNMTKKALEILSKDPDGFFLMIEGGKIDYAAHSNNKVNVALETIEFNYAVNYAFKYSKSHVNTLLIVTADHETGGLTILSQTLNNELPDPSKTYEENKILRIQRANNITVGWTTTGHTSKNVPLFGYGTGFYAFTNNSILDNTEIFQMMKLFFESQIESWLYIGIVITLTILGSISVITLTIYFIRKRSNKKSHG